MNKTLEVLLEEVDTWELATRMLALYRDSAKAVTGNAECRKIARMQVVVKEILRETCEFVERAEQESV